jgi:hypothetical protein
MRGSDWISGVATLVIAFLLGAFEARGEDLLLSDEVVPWQDLGKGQEELIRRPELVLEAVRSMLPSDEEAKTTSPMTSFLGRGPIAPGFEVPGGAVVQPQLVIWGEYRYGLQTFDNGLRNVSEFVNRLDLFANLYLSQTERFVIGFRPLDRDGDFTGYRSGGGSGDGWDEHFNADPQVFFFEGDLGEMFPNWDPEDRRHADFNLAVGRMPLEFQDGLMLNDSFDAVSLTRSSLFGFGSSALRVTGVYGFNEINRGDNREDGDASLYGLFAAADYEKATYEVDLVYVDGDAKTGGDGVYLGLGQVRRFGHWNSTLRANFSWALDDETAAVSTGTLLFSQLSRTMTYNRDIGYANLFWGIDDYASAARDPAVGGPLGRTGLLFDAVGLGEYGSALGNRANAAVGGALGYQHFLDERNRKQVVGEIGGRVATEEEGRSAGAVGARYQQAMGKHTIFLIDGFGALYDDDQAGYGGRCEMRFKF